MQEIWNRILEENIPKPKAAMHSYILQIDSTTDLHFDMIVVVQDALSSFTLYADKYASESYGNFRDILMKVKERFGTPSVMCFL